MHDPGLAARFGALSDPTRLGMVERLMREGEMSVGALSEPFSLSAPTISRHLSVLENAGLVDRRADGNRRLCRVNPGAVRSLSEWLETHKAFWEDSLDRLQAFFEKNQS